VVEVHAEAKQRVEVVHSEAKPVVEVHAEAKQHAEVVHSEAELVVEVHAEAKPVEVVHSEAELVLEVQRAEAMRKVLRQGVPVAGVQVVEVKGILVRNKNNVI